MPNKKILLIAGPTASGKSALALEWAIKHKAVIINADSMQVYRELQILTARPTNHDLSLAPHFLYGHISYRQAYSVASWYDEVQSLLENRLLDAKAICFVGGTGLYFKALLGGLSHIPDITHNIRSKWRQALLDVGAEELYRQLKQVDPELAQNLNENDGHRIVRALEVYEQTGKSLLYWHTQKKPNLLANYQVEKWLLQPERDVLNARIEQRVKQMFAQGVVSEVEDLLVNQIPAAAAIAKVIGLKEIEDFLDGRVDVDIAIDNINTQTKRYAKRQRTWFRHQFDASWNLTNI